MTLLRRSRARLPTGLLFLLFSGVAVPAPATVFLSPRLNMDGGYTSNRFLVPDDEGSAFFRTTPSLSVLWFGPGGLELDAELRYRRTSYLREGFQWQESAGADLLLRQPVGRSEFTCDLAATSFRDRSIPADDAVWIRLTPVLRTPLSVTLVVSLALEAAHTRFDSRQTLDGGQQRDTYLALRPGFIWYPAEWSSIWAELTLEASSSNETSDEYNGFAASLGWDALSGATLRGGVWARWNHRRYGDRPTEFGGESTDTPVTVSAWGTLGLTPWAELTFSGRWTDHASDDPLDDYRVWTVETGLRLVYDWRIRN